MNGSRIFGLIMAMMISNWAVFAQKASSPQAIYLYTMVGDSSSSVQLKQARALSIDLTGAIYIADTGNHRIMKFDRDGRLLKVVGGFGWGKEQFYLPFDIHASTVLDIFVADYHNHRIERYDKDLNYISSLYSNQNWESSVQFGYPKSIASSIHGELFIIDGENIRLLKLNSFGLPEISFGGLAEGQGRLVQPVQLAISRDDRIYVSDGRANKILVFDYFGNYLTEIGTNFLKEPQGIFCDASKRLLVADTGNKRVAVFQSNGELVLAWSQISAQIGTFQQPVDVAAFQQRIFVLDNDRVLVFELK